MNAEPQRLQKIKGTVLQNRYCHKICRTSLNSWFNWGLNFLGYFIVASVKGSHWDREAGSPGHVNNILNSHFNEKNISMSCISSLR